MMFGTDTNMPAEFINSDSTIDWFADFTRDSMLGMFTSWEVSKHKPR